MINNLFSIIIPTYNQSELLKKAINSVICQTYKNWEIIIIDNFSSDNTEEIINNFSNTKIKYFKFKNFGFISKSRNYGILKSDGNWISFLDSDDYWEINKLEYTNTFIKKNYHKGYNVFCHNEYKVDIIGNIITKLKYGPFYNNFFDILLIYGNKLSTSSTTINKSFLIKGNLFFSDDPKHITAEDYDLWLKIAKTGTKFHFSNKFLGFYLIHENSNSSTNIDHFKNVKSVVNDHLNSLSYKNKLSFLNIINTRYLLSSSKKSLNKKLIKLLLKICYISFFKIIFHKFICILKRL